MSAARDDFRDLVDRAGATIWPDARSVGAAIKRRRPRRSWGFSLPALESLRLSRAHLVMAMPVTLAAVMVAGPLLISLNNGGRNLPVVLAGPSPSPEITTTDPSPDNTITVPGPVAPTEEASPGFRPGVVVPASPVPGSATPAAPKPSVARGACNAADLSVVATTDNNVYGRAQSVGINITVRNLSTVDCPVDPGNCANEADVYDDSGRLVWRSSYVTSVSVGNCASAPKVLHPGETTSNYYSWNQQDCRSSVGGTQCTGGLAGAGRYHAGGIFVAADNALTARRSSFDLTEKP